MFVADSVLHLLLWVAGTAPVTGSAIPTKVSTDRSIQPLTPPCVNGTPAAQAGNNSWPIDYAPVGLAGSDAGNYTVSQGWYNKHVISSTYVGVGPGNDQYAAFKCQYVCNAAANCASYFGKYVDDGNGDSHYECILFDDLLDASIFVLDSDTMPGGGYNRLCNATREGLGSD
ncbi:hypothetical protein VTK73DRAFT_1587 [Phialemonium thermophilum]|uniref:Apple domain-containing protein n=1 Tax=Phialemonium thermophilum TaxID=223376 RepID=A0ABR3Y413_9PEZI